MPIQATCACGKLLLIGDQYANRRVRCPSCGGGVEVPPAPPPIPSSAIASSARMPPPFAAPPQAQAAAGIPNNPPIVVSPTGERAGAPQRPRKRTAWWKSKMAFWSGAGIAIALALVAAILGLNHLRVIALPSVVADNLPGPLNDRGYRSGHRLSGSYWSAAGGGFKYRFRFHPNGRFDAKWGLMNNPKFPYEFQGVYEFEYGGFEKAWDDADHYPGAILMVSDSNELLLASKLQFVDDRMIECAEIRPGKCNIQRSFRMHRAREEDEF